MKKSIMGLILTLISIQLFACYFDGAGECKQDGKTTSYFITRLFNPNSIYSFIVAGDTLEKFTTGPIVKDSLFSLPVSAGTEITMSYHYLNSDCIEYSTTVAAGYTYAGCGALPVRISNFYTQRKNNSTVLTFQVEEASDIDHYDVIASVYGDKYKLIAQIKADGSKRYVVPISPINSGFAVSAFLSLLILAKDKRKRSTRRKTITLLPLFLVMTFVACERISPQPYQQQYNYFKVQAVTHEGVVAASTEIKHN